MMTTAYIFQTKDGAWVVFDKHEHNNRAVSMNKDTAIARFAAQFADLKLIEIPPFNPATNDGIAADS